jgi:hypothetical protein
MVEVKDIVYRTVFTHLDQVYTVYSQGLSEETLVGFIELDSIIEVKQEVILSTESQEMHQLFIKQLASIKRTYVPMHAVVRIDEMTRKHYDFTMRDDEQEQHANVRHIHGGRFKKDDEQSSE